MVTKVEVYENGKRRDFRIVVAAICSITALEAYALYLGIDGTVLSLAVAAVAGIAGVAIPLERIKGVFKNAKG